MLCIYCNSDRSSHHITAIKRLLRKSDKSDFVYLPNVRRNKIKQMEVIMINFLKKVWCKMTGHKFYFATSKCDSLRCIKCGEWFSSDEAYGRWV